MGQRFGQLCELRYRQGRHRRVRVYRPNLARRFRPDDAPSSAPPTRCGAELSTTETDFIVPDFRLALERAWRLMLASHIDRALTVLEAIEQQLDDLSSPIATRYRTATKVLRLAAVACQDDSLAVLAIVIAQIFVEGGASFGVLLADARSRMEPLEPMDHRPPTFMSAGDEATQSDSSMGDAITARERDVLAMIGQGCSNKHIARKLETSPETVKSHLKNIFSKLDVATRSEAVSRALSLRLL